MVFDSSLTSLTVDYVVYYLNGNWVAAANPANPNLKDIVDVSPSSVISKMFTALGSSGTVFFRSFNYGGITVVPSGSVNVWKDPNVTGLTITPSAGWTGKVLLPKQPYVTVTPNGPDDGGDYGANTPNTTSDGIHEAINSLPSNRTEKYTVLCIGTLTVSQPVPIPSYTVLDLTQANILDQTTTHLSGSSIGACFYNQNFNPTLQNQDSHIEIIGGVIKVQNQSTNSSCGLRFGGATDVILSTNYIDLSVGYIGIRLDGGNQNVKIINPSVVGPSAIISYWNYGIGSMGSDIVGFINDEDVWIEEPYIFGISSNCILAKDVNGCHVISPRCYHNGNSASSNSSDAVFDLTCDSSSASGDIHIIDAFITPCNASATTGHMYSAGGVSGNKTVDFVEIKGAYALNCIPSTANSSAIFAIGGIVNTLYLQGKFKTWTGGLGINVNAAGTLGYCNFSDSELYGTSHVAYLPTTVSQLIMRDNQYLSLYPGANIINAGTTSVDVGKCEVLGGYWDGSGGSFLGGTGTTTLVKTYNVGGFNPQGFAATTPAVPATGTPQKNTNPYPVRVYLLTGGTGTAFTITDPSGTSQSITLTLAAGQEWTLDPNAEITLTYTVAPTWKWYGV